MKKKRNLIVVCCVAVVIFVATTIAYFSNGFDFLTGFGAEPFNTSVTEQFVSPQNWKPGDVTDKQVIATNNSDIDVAVRLSYTEKWVTANGDTISNVANNEKMAIINLDNRTDWVKFGGYYYYNDVLSKNESTSSFLSSVAFNPSAVIDDQDCTTSNDGSEITCISSGDGYDNATYSLTFNIEFVQADQYRKIWNTDFIIGNYYPFTLADYLTEDVNQEGAWYYDDTTKVNTLFTYNQPATDQTPALTEYRYIGSSPDNYVYFNCTDESDTSTCEVWRIVGVFDVENQNGDYKKRVKIMRGSPYKKISYNSIGTGLIYDEMNSGEYWNSLSNTARSMISFSKYYLAYPNNYPSASSQEYYIGERRTGLSKDYMFTYVALMYPSDYSYSFPNSNFSPDGWIYNSNDYNGSTGTWVVSYYYPYTSFYTSSNHISTTSSSTLNVRPVLYLNENTEYISGTGKVDDPYKIGIKSFNISIPESDLYSAPASAAIGSVVTINLNDNYELISFKLNGNLITGNSFIMPNEDAIITDVIYKKVIYNITNSDTDITVPENAHIGDTVNLESDNYRIVSFKLNGETITGNSFVMPEEDVIITDIEKEELIVVESAHYPYPNNQNYVQYYEHTFDGATSIRLDITYQLYLDNLYIYDNASASNYSYVKYYGYSSSLKNESYVVNGNYVKIKFKTNNYDVSSYYGFRIIVTPIYD